MSKFGWKAPSPSRPATTSSSIRGRISAPIPIPDDDEEFPIRSSGVSMATPLGHEGIEKQLRLDPAGVVDYDAQNAVQEQSHLDEPLVPSRAPPDVPGEPRLSYEMPVRQTTEINLGVVARSSTSTPASAPGKPERKKSTLRSVLGRLFGRKRKSGGTVSRKRTASRTEQHHSVCLYAPS